MAKSGGSRRLFLKLGAASAASVSLGQRSKTHEERPVRTMINVPFARIQPRAGLIGLGARGTALLQLLLGADVKVNALCDIVESKAENGQALVAQSGQKAPELYTNGEYAFDNMTAREDLDLVIIATPWHWHTEMAVVAMGHGKHVGVEVPGSTTLEECWQLVDTSEKTRRHCMMLENCCYGENETTVLSMIRAGLFGDLLYGEAAYLHDLRDILFSQGGEGMWRRTVHTQRNGNLYPTHGLGPVANYMDINRGDRFDYLVSMSTPAKGLEAYREQHIQKSDPMWKERYVTGDMNTSLIKTLNGLTINLQHDVVNPHPYDRLNSVAGTKGIFKDYPPRIYFDGQRGAEDYVSLDQYREQYRTPLWKKEGDMAKKLGGHGGMDFLMIYRLIECMRHGLAPDMDVYDAAALSAPGPLSRASVEQGSAPIRFPDFTRGRWMERKGSPIAEI
jgi:hypothetical protein